MVNNNNNRRRNNRNCNHNRRARQARSPYSSEASSSKVVQVRSAVPPIPSSSTPSPSASSQKNQDRDDDLDCFHESCIEHCFPNGRTTHANWRCFRFTNLKRFEGILRKRGYYDNNDRETHRGSGTVASGSKARRANSSSSLSSYSSSPDMVTSNNNHTDGSSDHALQQVQPVNFHSARDTHHHRAQHKRTVFGVNDLSSTEEAPKIKDNLYLFNNHNGGQKNQWGFVPEDAKTEVDVKRVKRVKKVKKMNKDRSATSTAPAAAENKNNKNQGTSRRRRQRPAHRQRLPLKPSLKQQQQIDEFPPSCPARRQTIFSGQFRARDPRFMYDVAVPVTIKGIEFTALADSTLFESRISSRVVEGLGLCVTPPMVLYCNPKTFYHSIGRTADDIPVYFCHLEEPKFVRFEVDEDMGYYDLKLGRQLFGDDDLTQHYKWARANGYM